MTDHIRYIRDEDGLHVTVNGNTVPLQPSLKVWNHSPSGFEIGYGGSGPAQLALAILLLYADKRTASMLHQEFKWGVLADPQYRDENQGVIEIDIPAWIDIHVKASET